MSVEKKVFKIMSQVMGVAPAKINEHSSPDTLESWDSLRHMSLVMALEEEFGIQFTDQQIVKLLSAKLIIIEVQNIFSKKQSLVR